MKRRNKKRNKNIEKIALMVENWIYGMKNPHLDIHQTSSVFVISKRNPPTDKQ